MTEDREISSLRIAMEIIIQVMAEVYVATTAAYFVMCLLLNWFVLEEPGGLLKLSGMSSVILFVAGLIIAFASAYAYGARWIRDLQEKQLGKSLLAKQIEAFTSMAITDAGAIFGLVLFLSSGHLVLAAILMMISTVAKIRLFPTRRWLRDQ